MTASIVVSDREETAQRLLASSARKSYDPMVEVDWEAPIPDDKFGLTPNGARSTAPPSGTR